MWVLLRTRKTKLLLAFAIVAGSAFIASYWRSRPDQRHSIQYESEFGDQVNEQLEDLIANVPAPVELVSVRMIGLEYYDRSFNSIHLPSDSRRDSYSFSGKVVLAGRTCQLDLESYEPIAGFLCENTCFVLTRHAFVGSRFRWYVEVEASRLGEISPDRLPRGFWEVRFLDDYSTYNYRIWLLFALSRMHSEVETLHAFACLLNQDGRFFFAPIGKEPSSYATKFLDWIIASKQRDAFFDGLVQLIELSIPADNCQTIAGILHAMLELRPVDGLERICGFREKLDLTSNVDQRVQAFNCGIEVLGRLVCP